MNENRAPFKPLVPIICAFCFHHKIPATEELTNSWFSSPSLRLAISSGKHDTTELLSLKKINDYQMPHGKFLFQRLAALFLHKAFLEPTWIKIVLRGSTAKC